MLSWTIDPASWMYDPSYPFVLCRICLAFRCLNLALFGYFTTPGIIQHGTVDWDIVFPEAARQQVYTSYCRSPDNASAVPLRLGLHSDTTTDLSGFQLHFDIDNAGGLASSLAVAPAGIKWKAGE